MLNLKRDRLPMWVVYSNPSDYPGETVARMWYTIPKLEPTAHVVRIKDLKWFRGAMKLHGFVHTGAAAFDDPTVMEVWV